jgi:hypothetical protein
VVNDDNSRTEHDAAHFAAIAGASEHVGNPVGDQDPDPTLARALGPDPWGLPDPKPAIPLDLSADPPF